MSSPRESLLERARASLTEAVNLDQEGRKTVAVDAYTVGIGALMELMHLTTDEVEQRSFREKIESYIGRAETLRFNGRQVKVEFLRQYRIDEDSRGHTYEKIFAQCLDEKLTEVCVEDPYIINHHQIMNFVMFCEMLVAKCKRLKAIRLVTSRKACDVFDHTKRPLPLDQEKTFDDLIASLKTYGVALTVEIREFHDREIRFNNGWLVKIGRGLDIYKPTAGKYTIGLHAYQFRPCKKTIVDIFKMA